MVAAPIRTTILSSLVLLAAGCLNNPNKPSNDSDDGGFGGLDGSFTSGDARLDTAVPADTRPADLAADLQTPVEAGPDGAVVPDGGSPDLSPDLAPDLMTCTPACTEGYKRCGPGGGLQTCVLVAGCTAWGPEATCGPNATCTGTAPAVACTCKPAPQCTGAGTFCKDASTVGTCAKDSFDCVYVTTTTTACPAGQLCGGSAPNGACGCSNTCAATQVGTYCIDAKTVATCTATNGCFASSNSQVCPGRQTCDGLPGAAACKCPAVGTTEGTGCPTAGLTLCEGNTVLTCTTEAGSNCRYWAKTTDCATAAGGPYTCGMRAGAPGCQCPDPSTTQIFVDPVAGRDSGTTAPPNGANSPASCRYKTLTKALASITTTRRRIVATTANPPASFTAETFPLVVPANVTVDTADNTPTPANYTVSFDSATATSAIQLGAGTTLEGYTIQASAGNTAASAISCTSGAVTLRNLVLVGATSGAATTKPATGIAIGTANADTCTGTLASLTVRNFRTGLVVTTASPTAVTITDSTLRDNGTGTVGAGLRISEGKVTATGLTVNKSTAGTATFGVVLDGTSTATVPSLTATDLTVSGVGKTGLELLAAAGMASPTATVTGSEIIAGATTDPGVRIQAGTLTLNGTNVHGAGSDGLRVEGGVATVGAGSRLDSNGRDGLRLLAGTAIVGASTGTTVSIAGNTESGIKIEAPNANASLTMTRTGITNSGKTGLHVDLAAAGATVIASDSDIHGNLDGVSIIRAPSLVGDAVALTGLRVFNNGRTGPGGVGVAIRGDTGNVVVSLKNSLISVNRDQGLLIRQGATFTTTATLEGNDIYGNNVSAGAAVGGIMFATSSTLASFVGNKVHANTGDEIGFDAPPNGGDTWDLSGGALCATPSQVYCYGAGNFGMRILDTAPNPTKVNAASISWTNLIPTKGTDVEYDMLKYDITLLPACLASAGACN
jgi:hypothetical protein